jgi:2-phospho-L-lactate guanylyltransferase
MKAQRRIWAIVPVKSFARAKARLGPVLDARQRVELVRAMLGDVLVGLRQVDGLAGIVVVSGDPAAREVARAHRVESIDDPLEEGPNEAVLLALPVLRRWGADAMAVIPSDVPQLEANGLQPIVEALSRPLVALVPAARDGGTNLLGCAPLDAIAPCFGPGSFMRHMAAANGAGLDPRVFETPSLLYDIDRPEDLREFAALHPTRTGAYLRELIGEVRTPDRLATAQ